MDPFKDIQVILSWVRGQGASWYDALGALLDLLVFVKGMIPAPTKGMRAVEGPHPAYTGLSLEALGTRLEDEANSYKANPQSYVNWQNLLLLLLAIMRYVGG